MANKPKDFPVFTPVDKATAEQMALKMNTLLGNLSPVLGVAPTEINLSPSALLQVIERIEKRRVYFHVFHNGCEMGELNEGALFCFWIVKLHPFSHPKIDSNVLNAKIAICLFINAIYYYSDKLKIDRKTPKHFIEDLYYSLVYRDITKEALMILAESFAE